MYDSIFSFLLHYTKNWHKWFLQRIKQGIDLQTNYTLFSKYINFVIIGKKSIVAIQM